MKLTIFAAAVLLMTSAVVMIQARSVTSQIGGIQHHLKVRLAPVYRYYPVTNCSKIRKINVRTDKMLIAQNTCDNRGYNSKSLSPEIFGLNFKALFYKPELQS